MVTRLKFATAFERRPNVPRGWQRPLDLSIVSRYFAGIRDFHWWQLCWKSMVVVDMDIPSLQQEFGVPAVLTLHPYQGLMRLNLTLPGSAGGDVFARGSFEALATCLSGSGSFSWVTKANSSR